ncbi:hypothetical protein [Chlorobium phaeovibrioides]|uniref:hypothetical protein n=1 Tax=Chlorobium phaeovibrioides TaxID=1094 RepID=UPI00163B43E9|nr:hypothetical protein [Chlorobium phaeovibrioides]MDT9546532.1 hypothetical protein [Chlorobium phaeovibrioides]
MIIKGFNGIFRTDNEGLPPTLGRSDNPEPQLNNTPPQRQAKCAIELIRRAGHWLLYEITQGNHHIDVIGENKSFHSTISKHDIFQKYEDWVAAQDTRRNRGVARAL